MPGLGLDRLGLPSREYRIDLPYNGLETGFESIDDAIAEDQLRADRLREHSRLAKGPKRRKRSRRLAGELERATSHMALLESMASYRYMRDVRIRAIGQLCQLYDQSIPTNPGSPSTPKTATILPRGWQFTLEQLRQIDPRGLMQQFRTDLIRAGASDIEGWLFAGLHGEFLPDSELYCLHPHIVASGDMIRVIDQLRRMKKYKAVTPSPGKKRPASPVRVTRQRLKNVPRSLSYTLQSWWPTRMYQHPGTAEWQRSQRRLRVPEPHHCEYLLWLDRWKLSDITLTMGLRIAAGGKLIAR